MNYTKDRQQWESFREEIKQELNNIEKDKALNELGIEVFK